MRTCVDKLGSLSIAAAVYLAALAVFVVLLSSGFYSTAFLVAFPLLMLPLVLSVRMLSALWMVVEGFVSALCVALVTMLIAPEQSLLGLLFGVTSIAAGLALSVVSHKGADSPRELKRASSGRSEVEGSFGEVTHDVLHIVDREGTALSRSASSYTMLGFLGKRTLQLAEYVHPDDLNRAKDELRRVFASGRSNHFALRFVSDARRSIPVDVKALRISERLSMMSALDRTYVSELERHLMETEARYRILIEQAIDTLDSGIIIIDQREEVLWANATVGRFFGIDRDRLIGVDARRARSRYIGAFEDAQSLAQVMENAIESRERIESMTCRVRATLGRDERVLEYRSIPIETEDRRSGRIDHFIDITQLKRLEESLREQTENLEHTNEKLEEFTHVVSHDLKEPLRSIETFAALILEDFGEELKGEIGSYLETLQRNAGRMRQLVTDLLIYSSIRIPEEAFRHVNASVVVSEVLEDLQTSLAKAKITIEEPLPFVKGSRTRLAELFANLLMNAVKHNDQDVPEVELGVKDVTDGVVTFFVRDNGPGIPKRYSERVFGVFERLHAGGSEGTGIGLAICKRIVEEHGGLIWLESEEGKGSTFYFTLREGKGQRNHD